MIMADLEYAKSMAISRGQNYLVEFSVDADSYSIKKEGDTDPISHPVKKGFPYIIDFQNDSRLNKVNIVSTTFSNDTVIFDILGSPDNGGTVSLQAGGTTMIVRVEPITGYIRVE
jgi:hypothetical protein